MLSNFVIKFDLRRYAVVDVDQFGSESLVDAALRAVRHGGRGREYPICLPYLWLRRRGRAAAPPPAAPPPPGPGRAPR